MLINGEKWACETCIKGHRATHCKHTDRQLVVIKKKGRPSTQCNRCRELRVIRQLHVKCDCEDQSLRVSKKNNSSTKKKIKIDILRPIAPKQDSCCENKKKKQSPLSQPLPPPSIETSVVTPEESISCCAVIESVPLPTIPLPSSCCGPPTKNQQGDMIRIVTCRCGDSCACIGCDAHPSRAMKEGMNDVYIGFDNHVTRRLSISAITNNNETNTVDYPTSILSKDGGTVLCGCGCSRTFQDCSDCFRELCSDYL